jgi:hypothetical protein
MENLSPLSGIVTSLMLDFLSACVLLAEYAHNPIPPIFPTIVQQELLRLFVSINSCR